MNIAREGLPFGRAISGMHAGQLWRRRGWNGKDMYVFLVLGEHLEINSSAVRGIDRIIELGDATAMFDNFLMMRTATGSFVPWLASQSDVLAEDWEMVA